MVMLSAPKNACGVDKMSSLSNLLYPFGKSIAMPPPIMEVIMLAIVKIIATTMVEPVFK